MKIALLTSEKMGAFPEVDGELSSEMKSKNLSFEWRIWNQFEDLDQFDVVLVRTIWDYWDHPSEFKKFLLQLRDEKKLVLNDVNTILWNMDKRYLRDLQNQKVAIVPTVFLDNFSFKEIDRSFQEFETDKLVLKPIFGAGADGAFVLNKESWSEQKNSIEAHYLNPNKPALIQPFLDEVQKEGEYSLIFFDKVFSHAILKTPKPGDFRSQEEFGSHIRTVEPTSLQLEYAKSILLKIEGPLLYSRVDFVMNPSKGPLLMELELIEPALYWSFGKESSGRFVRVLQKFAKQTDVLN